MRGNAGGKEKKKKTQGEDATSPQRRKIQFIDMSLKMHSDHSAALKHTCLPHYLPGLNSDTACVSRATQLWGGRDLCVCV